MKFYKYILVVLSSMIMWSCVTPFDLDMDDDPVIFLEAFPGLDDYVSFKIRPAYSSPIPLCIRNSIRRSFLQ